MNAAEVLHEIGALAKPGGLGGMARLRINTERAIGVSMTDLRALARRVGRDHALAVELWSSGVHEARILATVLADPLAVTPELMETWVAGFDSWDLCDQACGNLFSRTPFGPAKAVEWSEREPEFEKRARFALMASLALKRVRLEDDAYAPFLAAIERESDDDRNFVRKAVNWALRQIGKRNAHLRDQAIATASRIEARGTTAARWIARDALRELKPRGASEDDNG